MELRLSDRIVDLRFYEVRYADGRRERLSTRERQLLAYFLERRGQTISRDELSKTIWRHAPDVLSRAPDVMVSRLRKRLELDPAAPQVLVTVFGEGYTLIAEEVERAPAPVLAVPARSSVYFGDVGVDPERAVFVDHRGAIIESMTAGEVELLRALLEAHGATVERDVLARRLGSARAGGRLVSDAIYRLRRKIERDPSAPKYLLGVRGIGYRLAGDGPQPRQ